jgi:hypothetical protein
MSLTGSAVIKITTRDPVVMATNRLSVYKSNENLNGSISEPKTGGEHLNGAFDSLMELESQPGHCSSG